MNHPYAPDTRIEKINSDHTDIHVDGAPGSVKFVLGRMPLAAEEYAGVWGYIVEWDDLPGIDVGIAGTRIRPLLDTAKPAGL